MAKGGPGEKIRRQAMGAILSYAFFRFESAVIIAMTIVLIGVPFLRQPFPWWQWWYWLVLGLVAEALIVVTTVLDPEANQRVVSEMLRQRFDIRKLRDRQLREQLKKALEYRERIVAEIEREEDAVLDDHLRDVARSLDDWIAQIYRLARGLDAYGQDKVIARDMQSVPAALKSLNERLAAERNPSVQEQIREAMATKQAQWNTLESLRSTMAKAQLQLENTLSAMGTVYSQVLLLGAKDVDSGRAQRLREDIAGQVASLQDIAAAMDEVYYTSGSK